MAKTTFNVRRRTHATTLVSLLSLMAAMACSSESDDTTTLDVDSSMPAADQTEPATSTSEAADVAGDDYDSAELEALANDPGVFAMSLPFLEAPASDESIFVTMSDGVRLATNLYFPAGIARDSAALPTVYVDEWYGHNVEAVGTAIDLYRDAGFVVAMVDGRGYGASFGFQDAFLTPRARQDQSEMVDWLSTRPWSNGKVAAVGISLSGDLAAVMTGSGAPNLKAAIIRNADFDEYTTNMFPGGVPNVNMLEAIALGFAVKARGQECVDDLAACALMGVQPVDTDSDLSVLQAAFRDHRDNVAGPALLATIYRDDTLGSGRWSDMTPVEHPDVQVPARVSASWLDGMTSESALLYFASHPNTPMEIAISATTHMGGLDADPFSRAAFGPARPAPHEAFGADVAFVRRVLSGEAIGRSLTYYVLGADAWQTTGEWPPAGVSEQELALSATALTPTPAASGTELTYRVDPTATAGAFNRWASQRGGFIYYGDRRNAAGQRLSFDAAPVARDTELVGAPELCLALATDQADGLVVAYLEDVAPDGRVTYVTEGELRLLHRATRTGDCDPAPGTERSFERADAAPVVPGELMRVEIPLLSTAALVRQGHHLRLSLAGADAGTFPTLTDAPATWTVRVGGPDGSTLRVPSRPWSEPASK
jgi:putative CocE/NonD family hydrolase